MTYNRNLTALHKGLTPIHNDQDRANFAPKLAGGIKVLLADGVSYLTFNNLYDSAYDSSEEGIAAGKTYIPSLDGTIWTVSDIQGWWNLTDSEIPNIERGYGDGSFDITGRLLSRDLTITGSIVITDSSPTAIAAKSKIVREQLLDAFNLVKRGTWIIVNEDNEYQRACYVRLSGKPEVSTVNSRGRIDFSIGLRAPNPTKVEWFPVFAGGLIPEGFTTSDGNAYRYLKTLGGTSYYRDYPTTSSYSGGAPYVGNLYYTKLTQTGTFFPTYASPTVNITIVGGYSAFSTGDYINVTGITHIGATNPDAIGPFQVTGTTAGSSVLLKYTPPTGTTGIVVRHTPVITSAIASATASYASGTITITINYGKSSVQDGDYIDVSGLTYTGASGSTSGPFVVNGSTTVGGTTIKFTAPTGTTGVSGTPIVRTVPRVSAAYASNTITLTLNDATSTVKDGDYITVTGLTYTPSSAVTGPFLVTGGTTIGGSTIKYTAPTGTTGISGTPVVSVREYRDYASTGYYPIDDSTNNSSGSYRYYSNQTTDITSSGRFSVYNNGSTSVPCYIRFVGPLYGPAVIKNTTTDQQIDVLYTSELDKQVLAPSPTVPDVTQFLDIDTYTREVHKGDYFNGIYSASSRGSLSPLVDWIYLQPGINDFYYEDYGASSTTGRIEIYWRSGWDR